MSSEVCIFFIKIIQAIHISFSPCLSYARRILSLIW